MKALLAALPLGVLLACGTSAPPTIQVTASSTDVAAGGEITLNLAVENLKLVNPDDHSSHGLRPAQTHDEEHEHGEAADYPDEGHYHIYLDSTDVNPLMLNCPEHCKHPGFATTVRVTIPDTTSEGSHNLIVRLNNNEHETLTPHVKAEIAINVTSPQ